MRSLPKHNTDPMDSILSLMDKGFLELWMRAWVNRDDKLEIAVHSTHAFSERKEFAFFLMDIASSLIGDDWEKIDETLLSCRSCFDRLREDGVLPIVCSDCGRGVEDYVEKKTDS